MGLPLVGLVNNAGVFYTAPLEFIDLDKTREVFEVSFTLQHHPVDCLTGNPPSSFDCRPPNRLSYSPPSTAPLTQPTAFFPPSPLCR